MFGSEYQLFYPLWHIHIIQNVDRLIPQVFKCLPCRSEGCSVLFVCSILSVIAFFFLAGLERNKNWGPLFSFYFAIAKVSIAKIFLLAAQITQFGLALIFYDIPTRYYPGTRGTPNLVGLFFYVFWQTIFTVSNHLLYQSVFWFTHIPNLLIYEKPFFSAFTQTIQTFCWLCRRGYLFLTAPSSTLWASEM